MGTRPRPEQRAIDQPTVLPAAPAAPAAPDAGRGPGHLAALILLLVLPLALRLWPIGHGLPHDYLPDTHVVRCALGMAKEREPVPPVGRYSTYPYLLPYMLVPVYAARYGAGRLAGEWSSADDFARRLYEEPGIAHLPARVLVAVLAALAVWVTFRAARTMGLRAGAWFAAWLVATGLLHVHFSVQDRPWAPMVTFVALSAWAAAAYVTSGGRRSLVLSGAAAGLAFATHQAGAPALAVPAIAWIAGPRGWRGGDLPVRVGEGILCVAAFAVLALFLGHPYYLVHGPVDSSAVAAGDAMGAGAVSIGGQAFVFSLRWASLVHLGRAFLGYDPVLVLLALLGLAPALRRRRMLPATVFALGWAAVFLTNQNDHVRYLLPLAVLLAWPAGLAAERLWTARAARPLLLAALALPLVQALRLGYVLRQRDTRAIAAERLERELDRGATRLAVDFYGPFLPVDAWSLETIERRGTRELYAREAWRLAALRAGHLDAGGAWSVVRLEDLFGYEARTGRSWIKPGREGTAPDDPNALLAGLGVTHVLLVDRVPGDGRPPALVDSTPASEGTRLTPLRVAPMPTFVVDPGRPGVRARDARLPVELDFPLTELWRLARPGPRIELRAFGG